jgi:hypothetical protein
MIPPLLRRNLGRERALSIKRSQCVKHQAGQHTVVHPVVHPRSSIRHGEDFLYKPMDADPTARRRPAHGTPGDRPPAVPAVSHCSATQHHDQAVTLAPSAPIAERVLKAPGQERRALSGLAPLASTVLRIPLRGTRLRRAVDPGDLYQPSGPDGDGQAGGLALNARGEHA